MLARLLELRQAELGEDATVTQGSYIRALIRERAKQAGIDDDLDEDALPEAPPAPPPKAHADPSEDQELLQAQRRLEKRRAQVPPPSPRPQRVFEPDQSQEALANILRLRQKAQSPAS